MKTKCRVVLIFALILASCSTGERQGAFAGKTVLITGASRGFGKGAAREFARQGANVVLTARRGPLLDD